MKPDCHPRLLAACLVLISILASSAQAMELIPMAGFTVGGEFEDNSSGQEVEIDEATSFGLVVAIDSARDKQYELLFSQQDSRLIDNQGLLSPPLINLRIQHLHIGGNYYFDGRTSSLSSYVASGLGISRIDARVSGGDDKIHPSMNLGLGFQWMPSEALGLRLELRGYFTALDSQGQISCGGGCSIRYKGTGFNQFQLNSGVVFRF